MDLYLANSSSKACSEATDILWKNGYDPKILVSYHYLSIKNDLHNWLLSYDVKRRPKIFIDSGAFSALTLGVKIKIDEYCQYLQRYKKHFDIYANLDDMTCPEKTLENQHYMEKQGLSPIPVFHSGESFKYLEYYAKRYDYIALGNIVPFAADEKKLIPWIVRCFKIINGRAKIHGFGLTNWVILNSFPWDSVDSAAWTTAFRYFRLKLFDQQRGRFQRVEARNVNDCRKHKKLIRSYGFSPFDFCDRSQTNYTALAGINALSYAKAEQWISRRHDNV